MPSTSKQGTRARRASKGATPLSSCAICGAPVAASGPCAVCGYTNTARDLARRAREQAIVDRQAAERERRVEEAESAARRGLLVRDVDGLAVVRPDLARSRPLSRLSRALADEPDAMTAALAHLAGDVVSVPPYVADAAQRLARLLDFVSKAEACPPTVLERATRFVESAYRHLTRPFLSATIEVLRDAPPARWFSRDAHHGTVMVLLEEIGRSMGEAMPPSTHASFGLYSPPDDAHVDGRTHRKSLERAVKVLRSNTIVTGKAGGRGRKDRVSVERAAQLFAEVFVGPIHSRWRDVDRPTKTERRKTARRRRSV